MSLKFEISGAQIDGARDYQEDSFLISHLQAGEGKDQISLVIVADGMGGHAAGNVASNLAVQSFNKHVTTNYPSMSIPTLLKEAVAEANEAIAATIKETSALKGMGCTLVAALCIDEEMYMVSVGDSHLFHFHDEQLIKRNADHSYGGYLDRMASEGTEVDPEETYSRNMLLSALTGEPVPAIDCPDEPIILNEGDQILLCSDGVDTLEPENLRSLIHETGRTDILIEKILRDVEKVQAPRQDNTTIVAVKIVSSSIKQKTVPKKTTTSNTNTPIISSPAYNKSPAFQTTQPLQPVIDTRYSQRPAKKPSSGSWLAPASLIAIVTAGAWWYMNEKPDIIPTLENEFVGNTEVSIPATEINSETDPETETIAPSNNTVVKRFKDRLRSGGHAPEIVWILSGSYEMGGTGSTPPVNERPRHKVTLREFAISSKEVTRGEFAKFSGIHVSNTNRNQPVRHVSWKVAKEYTRWLSNQTGATYRLPSEAEWEYAARAGTTSPFWWGNEIGTDNAVCFGCSVPLEPTQPKGTASYGANAFGLYDTAGNVAEWVEDCYHENYETAPTDGSPWITENCNERVLRGGSYQNAPKSLFVSRRNKLATNKSENHIGFRVVRER